MGGALITIEGVEGCGKSTQIARLKTYLESKGHLIKLTREPGGTPIAEAIRRLVLDPSQDAMTPITELFLVEAARAQHVERRIRPALEAGKIVLCDRFYDSTTAYQGAGRGVAGQVVDELHRLATGDIRPDLTVVIDVPVAEGLKRARGQHGDRMERESKAFHSRVRDEFLRLAKQEPDRIKVVDGMQPIDDVARDMQRLVDALLSER